MLFLNRKNYLCGEPIKVKRMEMQSIGYMDAPVPTGIDIKKEIDRLRKENNAVILAHFTKRRRYKI